MRLSVCCLTADPGPRVAALLGPLREVAAEVVVAVDSRVDPERLGHFASVADRLLRFEHARPTPRAARWLCDQCSGDWILLIDGDEIISPGLMASLPGMIEDREVRQFMFPTHWLYPDADHWLAEPPWFYEANRLVRNDPATLWVSGLGHDWIAPASPSRHVDLPIYHSNLLDQPIEDRRNKVRAYLRQRNGHPADVMARDIPRMYLPEECIHAPVAEVPAADRPEIARALGATGPELPTPGIAIPLGTRAAIDATWSHRELPPSAYRARLVPLFVERRLNPGEQRHVLVRVHNDGSETWPGGEERAPHIRIAPRWQCATGTGPVESPRTAFGAAVAPGTSAVVPVQVLAPVVPGRWALDFDLVHGSARWFDARSEAVELDVG